MFLPAPAPVPLSKGLCLSVPAADFVPRQVRLRQLTEGNAHKIGLSLLLNQ